jgi:hypothetical protein
MALSALVLARLPLPDEMVMHGLAHAAHSLVFGSAAFVDTGIGLVWYDGWDFEAGLPRAFGAMLAPHKGPQPNGGCEESEDAPRTVKGLKVHGDAEALYNTVCIDNRFSAQMTSEYTEEFVARTAAREVGKSPAGLLAAEAPLAANVWMVSAWASDAAERPYPIDRALITVEYEAASKTTTVRLRVRPCAGKVAAVRATFDETWGKLEGAARALTDATEVRAAAGWLEVTFVVDDAMRAKLFAQVPDDLRAYEVILERQARR